MSAWGVIGLVLLTLVALGGLTWWVRIGRRRRRSGDETLRAVRLTPVPGVDQDTVRSLLADGEELRATMELSRSGALPLDHLEAALAVLGRGGALPETYHEAVDGLRHHEPELTRRLERMAREQGPMAATHRLMEEVPVRMLTAQGLIAALHGSGGQTPRGG